MTDEIDFKSKNDSIKSLKNMFKEWNDQIDKINEKYANTLPMNSKRTIKDDVGHLFVWQKITKARLEAAILAREPNVDFIPNNLDIESDDDLQAINDWIYSSNDKKTWSEIIKLWKENFSSVINLSEQINEETLVTKNKFAWLDGYPLIAVLSGTFNHHKEHLEKLQKTKLTK